MERRKWIAGALGAATLPGIARVDSGVQEQLGKRRTSPEADTNDNASVRQAMPVLAKHEGGWEGTYTFVNLRGEIQDQYDFVIDVRLSDDDAHAYQQQTDYRWPDGRTESRFFEAQHEQGQLAWDNGRIAGHMWQLDDRSLYLRFGFAANPDVACFEMIQISDDGQRRGRSWLWYRNDVLYQSVLVDERRVRR